MPAIQQSLTREARLQLASRCARLNGPFLTGLQVVDIEHIMSLAAYRRASARSAVINQGEPADHVFLLVEGRARYFFVTEEGRKLLLHWLVPGEMFGGAALLVPPASYIVGTEMVEDGTLLSWEAASLRRLATEYPRIIENALCIFADYMAFYVATHAALTGHTARQRLASLLVTLAGTIGRPLASGIELDVTNEELADASNVTRFTASRLINEWQRCGILEKSRGRILLCSPERLSDINPEHYSLHRS